MSASMASATADTYRINIKTLNPHATHEVEVQATEQVSVLQSKLEDITGIPPERQRLLYLGRALTDGAETLNAAGIESGHTLHLVERPQQTDRPHETQASAGDAHGSPRGDMDQEAAGHIMGQVLGSLFHAFSADGVGAFVPNDGMTAVPFAVGFQHDGGGAIPMMPFPYQAGGGGRHEGGQPRQGRPSQSGAAAHPVRPLLTTLLTYLRRLTASAEGRSALRPLVAPPSTVLPEARRIDNERRWFSSAQEVLSEASLEPETRRWVESAVAEALSAPPLAMQAAPAAAAAQEPAQQGTNRDSAAETRSNVSGSGENSSGGGMSSRGEVRQQGTGSGAQQPWEVNPSNPQVASVVAVALGHLLQRSQEVWTTGPQAALERSAQLLQSLTEPVPRGSPVPAHPAVDAVSAAGRHLYAFGAIAWELARLCRMVGPALQGQTQLQLATGRPAFITPEGTAPMMPFGTGRPGRGGNGPGAQDANRRTVRLPNGSYTTSNVRGGFPVPEEVLAGLATAFGGIMGNGPQQAQPQQQGGHSAVPIPVPATSAPPALAMSAGTAPATSAGTAPTMVDRGTQTVMGGALDAYLHHNNIQQPTSQPEDEAAARRTSSEQRGSTGGFSFQLQQTPDEALFQDIGTTFLRLSDRTDTDVTSVEVLPEEDPPFPGEEPASTASAAATIAQAQLRAMITGVVAPAVQQALMSSGLLGASQPADSNASQEAGSLDDIASSLGSTIAEALQPSLPMLHDFMRQLGPLMASAAAAAAGGNLSGGDTPESTMPGPFQAFQGWLQRNQGMQESDSDVLPLSTSEGPSSSSSTSSSSSAAATAAGLRAPPQQPTQPMPSSHGIAATSAPVTARTPATSLPQQAVPAPGTEYMTPMPLSPEVGQQFHRGLVERGLIPPGVDGIVPGVSEPGRAPEGVPSAAEQEAAATGSAQEGSAQPAAQEDVAADRVTTAPGPADRERSSTSPHTADTAKPSSPQPPPGGLHGPSLSRPGARPSLPARSQQRGASSASRRQPSSAHVPASNPSAGSANLGETLAALSSITAPRAALPARSQAAERPQSNSTMSPGLAQLLTRMAPVVQQIMSLPTDDSSSGENRGGSGVSGDPGRVATGESASDLGGGQSMAAMMGPLMQQMGPMLGQMLDGGGDAQLGPLVQQVTQMMGASGEPATASHNAGASTDVGFDGALPGLSAMMPQIAASPAMQRMIASMSPSSQDPVTTNRGAVVVGEEGDADICAPPSEEAPNTSHQPTASTSAQLVSPEVERTIRAALPAEAAQQWLDTLRADAPRITAAANCPLSQTYLNAGLSANRP